ncbi:hypothetical protein BCR39DRAFT_582185 [Naematelia encephala]|uniref:Uncharacterized protein n=1 Tax=Naematelia encephala TaxID=71784 RepID=A0A1Y2BE13_9TREE|nr:hypothetical protein BCR39DRAFT_582185 [Naematelia encephala]
MSRDLYSQDLPSGGDTYTRTNPTRFTFCSRSTKFLKKAFSRTGHSIAMISCLMMPKPDLDRFNRLTNGPRLDTKLNTSYQPTSYRPTGTSYRPTSDLTTSVQSPRNTGYTSSRHYANPGSGISSHAGESSGDRTNDGIDNSATSVIGKALPPILEVYDNSQEEQLARTEIPPEGGSTSTESDVTDMSLDGDISSSEGSVTSMKSCTAGASSNTDIFMLRQGLGAIATASKSRLTCAPRNTQYSGQSRFGRFFGRNPKSHTYPSVINSQATTNQHETTYIFTNIRKQTPGGSRATLGIDGENAGGNSAWRRWWKKSDTNGKNSAQKSDGVIVTVDRETFI